MWYLKKVLRVLYGFTTSVKICLKNATQTLEHSIYVLVRLSYVLGIFVEHARCVLCILVECSSN